MAGETAASCPCRKRAGGGDGSRAGLDEAGGEVGDDELASVSEAGRGGGAGRSGSESPAHPRGADPPEELQGLPERRHGIAFLAFALLPAAAARQETMFDAVAFLQDSLAYGIGHALSACDCFRSVASCGKGVEAVVLQLLQGVQGASAGCTRWKPGGEERSRTRPESAWSAFCLIQGRKGSPSCVFERQEGRGVPLPATEPCSLAGSAPAGALCAHSVPPGSRRARDAGAGRILSRCRMQGIRELLRLLEDVQKPEISGHGPAGREPSGTRGGMMDLVVAGGTASLLSGTRRPATWLRAGVKSIAPAGA